MTACNGCKRRVAGRRGYQHGAVLLLMLLGLMLSGAGTLLALQGGLHTGPVERISERTPTTATQGLAPSAVPVYLRAERDARVLHQAKIALLAYAVTYADNYNPSGAGPGHFPCPDLDPPDDNNPHNDGPNPPCSQAARQLGRMPRLTTATRDTPANTAELAGSTLVPATHGQTLPENRIKVLEFYPLHTHLDQQPWYQVDDGFINNPLNRQVNFSSRSHLSNPQERDVVARVIAPGASMAALGQQRPSISHRDYLEQTLAGITSVAGSMPISRDYSAYSNDIVMPVYLDELMPLVLARVAGFVQDTLLAFRQRHCSPDAAQQTPPCFPFAAQVAAGHGDIDANSLPAAACSLGLHRGHLPIEAGNCPAGLSIEGAWQGVDNERHWFIRNGWPVFFDYQLAPECVTDVGHRCRVAIELPVYEHATDLNAAASMIRVSVVMPG